MQHQTVYYVIFTPRALRRPILFIFGSRMWFSETTDRMTLFLPTTCMVNLICLQR